MNYDLEFAAEELLLSPAELQDVFRVYFKDAAKIITACYEACAVQDHPKTAKLLHALKGSSNSLQIITVATMVAKLEELASAGHMTAISQQLPQLENELQTIQSEINEQYRKLGL